MYGQIPYMMANPYPYVGASNMLGAKTGITGLLGKLNFSNILSGASKALNVANQAIPLYRQVKPVINNIKMVGKIGREFTKMGNSNSNISSNDTNLDNENSINNEISNDISNNINNNVPNPTFFI